MKKILTLFLCAVFLPIAACNIENKHTNGEFYHPKDYVCRYSSKNNAGIPFTYHMVEFEKDKISKQLEDTAIKFEIRPMSYQ